MSSTTSNTGADSTIFSVQSSNSMSSYGDPATLNVLTGMQTTQSQTLQGFMNSFVNQVGPNIVLSTAQQTAIIDALRTQIEQQIAQQAAQQSIHQSTNQSPRRNVQQPAHQLSQQPPHSDALQQAHNDEQHQQAQVNINQTGRKSIKRRLSPELDEQLDPQSQGGFGMPKSVNFSFYAHHNDDEFRKLLPHIDRRSYGESESEDESHTRLTSSQRRVLNPQAPRTRSTLTTQPPQTQGRRIRSLFDSDAHVDIADRNPASPSHTPSFEKLSGQAIASVEEKVTTWASFSSGTTNATETEHIPPVVKREESTYEGTTLFGTRYSFTPSRDYDSTYGTQQTNDEGAVKHTKITFAMDVQMDLGGDESTAERKKAEPRSRRHLQGLVEPTRRSERISAMREESSLGKRTRSATSGASSRKRTKL